MLADQGQTAGSYMISSSQREELLRLPLAANQLQFEEQEFRDLLADSISLSFKEKKGVLAALGELTQQQMDQLLDILREERAGLRELDQDQYQKLEEIGDHAKEEQDQLARDLAEKLQQEKDSEAIRKIREELFGTIE